LPLDEALAAVADETSWIPDGDGDNPLFLRITESGYEEYVRAYPPTMFDPAAVAAVFEEATGVRLELYDDSLRRELPQLRLPQATSYNSPGEAEDRLGGKFTVVIYSDGDWPDRGVRDYGLRTAYEERGDGYYITGEADRANVEVTFFRVLSEAAEITPEAEATWAVLISCLRRLSESEPPSSNPSEDPSAEDPYLPRGLITSGLLVLGLWGLRRAVVRLTTRDLAGVFDPATVRAAFEEGTGVRLVEATRAASLPVRLPELGVTPGRFQVFVSPKDANIRFEGRFEVRLDVDSDTGDEGVVGDRRLRRTPPSSEVAGHTVYARASRANVELAFTSDDEEITPKAEETWALLRSCLERL
jgi:hypothetical protein